MNNTTLQTKLFFGDELDNNINLYIAQSDLMADDIVSIKYAVCALSDDVVMPTALLIHKWNA